MSSESAAETDTRLPLYTPSPPPPKYAANITEGERSLAHTTSRLHPNCHTPTSTLTRTRGNITVVLNEQDDDAEVPSYGRHALISGIINLEHTENVSRISLKIEGRLKLSISGSNAVSKTIKIVDECYELWSEHSGLDKSKSCPHSVPFSSILPSTFKDGERELPLPPSYEVTFLGVPTLFARCMYAIKVTIHTHGTLLGRSKTLTIPVIYRPRKRPPRPILYEPSFLSTVKTSPEEWYQSTSELKARPSTNLGSIHAHLFIPAVRTFGLADSIPFHIQLTGLIPSLREFYSHVRLEESDDFSSPSPSTSSSHSSSLDFSPSPPCTTPPSPFSPSYHSYTPYAPGSTPNAQSPSSTAAFPLSSLSCPSSANTSCAHSRKNNLSLTLSLTLHRQVSVEIKGQIVWKNVIIGSGKLRALPPSFWSRGLEDVNEEEEASLDWEGEVRCRRDVTVGHFNARKIAVKDFLSLSIDTKPNQSAFYPLRMAVPIALVTDTWSER